MAQSRRFFVALAMIGALGAIPSVSPVGPFAAPAYADSCDPSVSYYIGDGTNGDAGITYRVLTFSNPGQCDWNPGSVSTVDVLVVAGGGGGGGYYWAGGGGAGGVLYGEGIAVEAGANISITVGAGGAGGANAGKVLSSQGKNGESSSFGAVVAAGGGGGAYSGFNFAGHDGVGADGGSGGGVSEYGSWGGWNAGLYGNLQGGKSTMGTLNLLAGWEGFGNDGGPSPREQSASGSGGGGAGSIGGQTGTVFQRDAGDGGAGREFSITGTSLFYAGGGGGGTGGARADCSVGGVGGGGDGGCDGPGEPGQDGLGAGGGGAGYNSVGGSGGDGVVIVRYSVTVSFDVANTMSVGEKLRLVASDPSGGTVTFRKTNPDDPCTINGKTVIATGVGECTVTATGSETSVTRTITIGAVTPGIPALTSASFGHTHITIGFVSPEFDGGAPITGYKAIATPSGPGEIVEQQCGIDSPCVVGGLTNGTVYTVTLAAENVVGVGKASQPSPVVTPADVPDAVTALRTTPGDGKLLAEWAPPSELGGGDFRSYEVFVRESGGPWPQEPTVVLTDATAGAYTFEGLINGTAYDVKVDTVTFANDAELRNENLAVALGVPVTVPDAPPSITVTALSPTSFIASWPVPEFNGGSPILEYALNPQCELAHPTDTFCVATGVTPGSRITVSVAAVNLLGNSGTTQVGLLMPALPANSGAKPSGENKTTEKRAPSPAIHLDLQATVGQKIAGAPVVIGGQGLADGSGYTLALRSGAQEIDSGLVSALGNFSKRVSMPALTPGSYTLTLMASAPDGSRLTLLQTFTVGADGTITAVGSPVGSRGPALAATGLNQGAMVWSAGLAMVLFVVGVGAVSLARVRHRSSA